MECRQVVRSASRGMRTASSLFQPARSYPSALILRQQQQQQRFQSSSSSTSSSSTPPRPNRSTIDDLLSKNPYKPAAPSKSSVLTTPRGAGFAFANPPKLQNKWAAGLRLAKEIEKDAEKARAISGVDRSSTWRVDDFATKYNVNDVEDIRLTPSIGRMVHVPPGGDVRRSIAVLDKVVARNAVRNMNAMGRFHERPALKRKRRLRDAWRVRFKKGFKAVVHRAMELRAQGW